MKKFAWILLLILTVSLVYAAFGFAEPPPPPVGPGADAGKYVATPIGGGILILLSVIGYGIYRSKKNS